MTSVQHGLTPPIGVFDSGIGGLSILQALRAELPEEDFVYLADSAHAPYGEREATHIIERARKITGYLCAHRGVKALVVACNTATAAAIHLLRQEFPTLPIIGVEPALKPAVSQSQTRRIGVLATRGTLHSTKFEALVQSLATQADFVCQPCDGLADAIEREDTRRIDTLCQRYTQALGPFGADRGQIDTLVLGCTHYPFVSPQLAALVGPAVRLIDNGLPVARQTRRMLTTLAPHTGMPGRCVLLTTGEPANLQRAASHWLQLNCPVESLPI